MADFTQTRYSALVQLLLATLLVIFGIVDRVIVHSASSTVSFGIWVGLWVWITAVLGCLASRIRLAVNWALVWSYLGFSVTAAIFSGTMIIMYSLVLAYSFDSGSPNYYLKDGGVYYYGDQAQSTRITISAIVLFLAVVEFGVSIWSAITCCQANGCVCCQNATQNNANQGGFPASQNVTVAYPSNAVQMPVSSVPMIAVHGQVPTSGGPMVAVPMQQSGSPMAAVHVPSSEMGPVMAVPSHVVA